MKKLILILALLASLSLADTYSQSFSGGLGGATNPVNHQITSDITTDPAITVAPVQATYAPGSTVTISFSMNPYRWGATTFNAVSACASNTQNSPGGALGAANINFVTAATFNSMLNYYNTCGVSFTGGNQIHCTNNPGKGDCTLFGTFNSASCMGDFVGGATYTALRPVTYQVPVSGATFNGYGTVAAFCNGRWSLNGADQGEIGANGAGGSGTVTLPAASGTSTQTVSAAYTCMFILRDSYLLNTGTVVSTRNIIYTTATSHTSTATTDLVVAPACTDASSITVTATNPINIVGGTALVTLTVTNTGNVPVTINAAGITSSVGTFTPITALPITIAAGGSANIAGTFTYGGASTTATFTVTGSATVCGAASAPSATSAASTVNACAETGSITVSATNPITLDINGNANATLTVTNTGNQPVTIAGAASILTAIGTFTPTTALPITLAAGASATIDGTYSYGGGTPVTETFTVNADCTLCGAPVVATATATATVNGCPLAGIFIIGVLPDPVALINRSAAITVTVQNNGTAIMNVTGFATSSALFTFTPDDAMPVTLTAGQIYNFNGNLSYSGSLNSIPSPVGLTVFANTSETVCGGTGGGVMSVNSTINITILQKGDLEPSIAAVLTMNQTAVETANVTVRNRGSGNVTDTTILNIRVLHCTGASIGSCSGSSFDINDNRTVGAIIAGENVTETVDYACNGYPYVLIRAIANRENLTTVEDNFANNMDTATVVCSTETCEMSGPAEILLPGAYDYGITCKDSGGSVVDCGTMMQSPGFTWTYSPAYDTVISPINYAPPVFFGSVLQNSTIYVNNIIANGTLVTQASGTTNSFHQTITCTHDTNIVANVCILQI